MYRGNSSVTVSVPVMPKVSFLPLPSGSFSVKSRSRFLQSSIVFTSAGLLPSFSIHALRAKGILGEAS